MSHRSHRAHRLHLRKREVILLVLRKIQRWFRRLLRRLLSRRPRFAHLRAAHLRLGRRGERIAATVLQERGLELLCRNFRARRGELDLVMREGTTLVVAEVKTRHRQRFWEPADAVDAAKRKNLIRTAAVYLKQLGSPELQVRFDIVEVIFEGGELQEVRHLRNAFRPHRRHGISRPQCFPYR